MPPNPACLFACRLETLKAASGAPSGAAGRSKIADCSGGTKEDSGRKLLGLVVEFDKGDTVISVEEAVRQVSGARSERREAKLEDGPVTRLTVAQAWAFYPVEKQVNRDATHTKDASDV